MRVGRAGGPEGSFGGGDDQEESATQGLGVTAAQALRTGSEEAPGQEET